ncbi:glutamyl-tRNA(Gln) amidotransferase subunit A [Pycnococcus provasolii]
MASGVETLLGCARLLRKNLVEPASLLALSRSRHLSYNPLYNYACSSWLWEEEETENLAPRSLGGVVVNDTFVDSFGGSCGSPSGSTSSFVAGIPLVVKDNIAVAGHVMQAASAALRDSLCVADADAVASLRHNGARLVLRTNMDEFGFGSFGIHSPLYGTCRNARDATRVAGGSSSGSATAVALGVVPAALGTDTGGSVRLPACYQGIVGYRPSYGLVSRQGLVAYASSMDTAAVLARYTPDACAVLESMVHPVRDDDTAVLDAHRLVPPRLGALYCDAMAQAAAADDNNDDVDAHVAPLNGVRVAVLSRECFPPNTSSAVCTAHERAAEVLRSLGAHVTDDVHLPLAHGHAAVSAYYAVAMAEAASNLARYGAVPTRYGPPVGSLGALLGDEAVRRVLTGTALLGYGVAADYRAVASSVRRAIAREYRALFRGRCDGSEMFCPDVDSALGQHMQRLERAFEQEDARESTTAALSCTKSMLSSQPAHPQYHILLTPAAPTAAPTLEGAAAAASSAVDSTNMAFDADAFLAAPSLAGHPAVSVPAGVDANEGSMPVGIQLVGDVGADVFLLGVASALGARLLQRNVAL